MSNNSSQTEKNAAYENVSKESKSYLSEHLGMTFIYLDRVSRSSDRVHYEEAIRNNNALPDPLLIFNAVDQPFENRNGDNLKWILYTFFGGAVLFLISLLFKPFSKRKRGPDTLLRQRENWAKVVEVCKRIFVFNDRNRATQFLIGINIIVFIIGICITGSMSFSEWDLLYLGANYRQYFENGQYWRLLTSMFLYTGFVHLFFNLCGLVIAGVFTEPVIGKTKFVVLYLICGVIGALVSIGWRPEGVSVGASGAIFGIYGVFLALLSISATPKNFGRAFLIIASFFLGFSLLFTITGVVDMVSNLCSLCTGFICGYIVSPFIKRKEENLR
jgi:rhomboid protease GluP